MLNNFIDLYCLNLSKHPLSSLFNLPEKRQNIKKELFNFYTKKIISSLSQKTHQNK